MLHIAANHPVAMPTDENNFPVRLNPVIFWQNHLVLTKFGLEWNSGFLVGC
jgi:hypothetical protein